MYLSWSCSWVRRTAWIQKLSKDSLFDRSLEYHFRWSEKQLYTKLMMLQASPWEQTWESYSRRATVCMQLASSLPQCGSIHKPSVGQVANSTCHEQLLVLHVPQPHHAQHPYIGQLVHVRLALILGGCAATLQRLTARVRCCTPSAQQPTSAVSGWAQVWVQVGLPATPPQCRPVFCNHFSSSPQLHAIGTHFVSILGMDATYWKATTTTPQLPRHQLQGCLRVRDAM